MQRIPDWLYNLPPYPSTSGSSEPMALGSGGLAYRGTADDFITNYSYLPSSTGGVARTIRSKLEEYINVMDFGAANDGSTSDVTAIQAAIDAALAKTNGGTVYFPAGAGYVIDSQINCYPSADLCLCFERGAVLVVNMTGASSVALYGTHPSTPSTRGNKLHFHNLSMQFHSDVTTSDIGAIFIEKRHASGLMFSGYTRLSHYRNNTVVRTSDIWNGAVVGFMFIFGGGHVKTQVDTSGVTFSLSNNSRALTSSGAIFAAGHVGKKITLAGPSGRSDSFEITAYSSTTAVTVDRYNTSGAYTTRQGVYETIKGSISSSGTTLTMDSACLVASDAGRSVIIAGAGASGDVLRALISTVDSTTQCTLDTAAGTTVTSGMVQFSPVWEQFTGGDKTNDFKVLNLHITDYSGLAVFVDKATGFVWDAAKIEARGDTSSTAWATTSSIAAWFNDVEGRFEGMVGQYTCTPEGQVWVTNQSSRVMRIDMTGEKGTYGIPSVYQTGGDNTGGVIAGHLQKPEEFDSVDFLTISTDNSAQTVYGGYPSVGITPIPADQNYIFNGHMNIAQRGTSFTGVSAGATTLDGWIANYDGGGSADVTQQTLTVGSESPEGSPYFIRYDKTVAASGATFETLAFRIESVKTLNGKRAMVRFGAKAAAEIELDNIRIRQYFGTGGSPSANVNTTVDGFPIISTNWRTYSYLVDIPTITGKTIGSNGDDYLQLYFSLPLDQTFTFDLRDVTLMKSEAITDRPMAMRNPADAIAFAKRYYEAKTVQSENGARHIPLVTKRAAPTVTTSTGTATSVTIDGFELTTSAAATSCTVTASAEL